MGEDAGKWINRVSHQLKRQMSCEDQQPGQDDLTNMQKHILHFILLETMHRDLSREIWKRSSRSAGPRLREPFSFWKKRAISTGSR